MKPEIHAIVTAVNELTRQMAVDAERIENLEAALREITWIATPDHEDARNKATEIARNALEGKDD
jgi:hypothetical protein